MIISIYFVADACKKHWKGLRDYYQRVKKKPTGSAAGTRATALMERLSFVAVSFETRRYYFILLSYYKVAPFSVVCSDHCFSIAPTATSLRLVGIILNQLKWKMELEVPPMKPKMTFKARVSVRTVRPHRFHPSMIHRHIRFRSVMQHPPAMPDNRQRSESRSLMQFKAFGKINNNGLNSSKVN